ncbi:IclR family transcriptional regulator [Jannaschia sp. M317]|uniref:IclR family transcriptional regulator n=1 Tax=Jannaschia sp. M317 TaxID=2867011 RepID=UPI0021A72401|nr:IclR family transcriptional regulator [Jannaschia sp. M317]UWQ18419.1 IclR family transcriptional regulator [Jannaschia sp. M317]
MDGQNETIPTNLRLVLVLEEMSRSGAPVTPTSVNARLGLPKPTIHRLFATLEAEGFLQRDIGERAYLPGPRLRRMAGGVLSTSHLQSARRSILTRLSRTFGETCNISLPDGENMVYIERVETEWPLRIQLPIGTRVPLYATAAGKMFLSTMPDRSLRGYLNTATLKPLAAHTFTDPEDLKLEIECIRRDGHATDRGEFMEDMVAVAVPILDANDRLLATLSVHAPVQRMSVTEAIARLPELKAAAAELSLLSTD